MFFCIVRLPVQFGFPCLVVFWWTCVDFLMFMLGCSSGAVRRVVFWSRTRISGILLFVPYVLSGRFVIRTFGDLGRSPPLSMRWFS